MDILAPARRIIGKLPRINIGHNVSVVYEAPGTLHGRYLWKGKPADCNHATLAIDALKIRFGKDMPAEGDMPNVEIRIVEIWQ